MQTDAVAGGRRDLIRNRRIAMRKIHQQSLRAKRNSNISSGFVLSLTILACAGGCTLETIDDTGVAACPSAQYVRIIDAQTDITLTCAQKDDGGAECAEFSASGTDRPASDFRSEVTPLNFGKCAAGFQCVSDADLSKVCLKASCGGESVNIFEDAQNCGACGTVCNYDQACIKGFCQRYARCGDKDIDPLTNINHCGAKGTCDAEDSDNPNYRGEDCSLTPDHVCNNGRCGLADPTKAYCDGQIIDPDTNSAHCGARGNCSNTSPSDINYAGENCAARGKGFACKEGICQIADNVLAICGETPIYKTDGDDADGNGGNNPSANENGENVLSDAELLHCGAKGFCNASDPESENFEGYDCKSLEGHTCRDGKCAISDAGAAFCDDKIADPKTDQEHCGAKDYCSDDDPNSNDWTGENCNAKPMHECRDGKCQLPADFEGAFCDGKIIDPKTDLRYCGAKRYCANGDKQSDDYTGEDCSAKGEFYECADGKCKYAKTDSAHCGGKDINPKTNSAYCGAKGDCTGNDPKAEDYAGVDCSEKTKHTADDDYQCKEGECALTCAGGKRLCQNSCIDGTNVDACDDASTTCKKGYGNCNSNLYDGCETNLQTSSAHCGACGNACEVSAFANAAAVGCKNGECMPTACEKGYAVNNETKICEVSKSTTCCGTNCKNCEKDISQWKTDNKTGSCLLTGCQPYYIPDGNACKKVECTQNSHCAPNGNICFGNACKCGSNFFIAIQWAGSSGNEAYGNKCAAPKPYCVTRTAEVGSKLSLMTGCVECSQDSHCAPVANGVNACAGDACAVTCDSGYHLTASNACEKNTASACGKRSSVSIVNCISESSSALIKMRYCDDDTESCKNMGQVIGPITPIDPTNPITPALPAK